jgi:NADH dehydrogenase FAD-containing subunit
LHHDTIIQTLYGDLSPEELKAERTRIKTALLTGVKDGKWQKASVPSNYLLGDTAAGAKPKRPGRKPDPTKEPIPQPEPVAEVVDAKAPHQEYAPAPAKAKAAMPKLGRESAVAKASQKTARPKKTELELVALLRKADIQV